jgi:small subunit ribosomal protein S13
VAYLFETRINEQKKVVAGLSQVFGIGRSQSEKILFSLGIQKNALFSHITKNDFSRIKKLIEKNFLVGSRLRQETTTIVQGLVKLRCYRGSRHKNRLPVRGQRSSSNARTQKRSRKI